ncbi:MAG: hypothetical protein WBA44_01980 [Mesorhizobium sp.]
MRNNPISEVMKMLPKLALIAGVLAATGAFAGQIVGEGSNIENSALVAIDAIKPSGVGFVLAVSLQRNGAGLR